MNRARPIECDATPDDVLARWPADQPLAVLYSGAGPDDQARWTVIARPAEVVLAHSGQDWELQCPFLNRPVRTPSLLVREEIVFSGGWIGWISYDLGREIEPRAQAPNAAAARDRHWPIMEWHRCDQALVHDRATGAWWVVGEGWEHLWQGAMHAVPPGPSHASRAESGVRTAPPESGDAQRSRYFAACERVLEYIRAGDIYQANLAHRISHTFEGSARAMFRRLLSAASPWFGAYVERTQGDSRHAVCSVSPELLFKIDPATGRIVTRPMKGTRAPGPDAERALRESDKDRAELHMIVDLMRNDLGRVCEVGSVRVERGRDVEWHGAQGANARGHITDHDSPAPPSTSSGGGAAGILQATATVVGIVREGATLADVIRAIVPGGSVTGAPKIRAMQIIDELEPVRRGPYCGAVGFVGDDGSCAMNVAIRTALITGHSHPASSARDAIVDGTLDYSVGAGIVADSSPEAEWLETLEKAGVLRAAGMS